LENSGASAISLAVQSQRHEIVERLIEFGVEVSIPDACGKSPLFYATANEDLYSVKLLVGAGAHPNDGSLHEAARLCHNETVMLLLSSGHEEDYTSHLHQGRTALGELCFQASLDSGKSEAKAFTTIKLFMGPRIDLTIEREGKKMTILHLALMNNRPVEITRVLLRFSEICKDLKTDSETFLYEDANGISISPNHFVTEHCRCNERHKRELQELLKYKCKSKRFKKRGKQIHDPEGLPPAMQEIQDSEDLADQKQLRRIEREKFQLMTDLQIDNERHNAKIKQNQEFTNASLTNNTLVHNQKLDHNTALFSQSRRNANLEREDQQNHAGKMANIEYNAKSNLNQLTYTAKEREHVLQKRMIQDNSAAEQHNHNLAMRRIDRQEESAKVIAREQNQIMREQRLLIEASRAAKIAAPSQLRLLDRPTSPD
jgi:hypothetical protein